MTFYRFSSGADLLKAFLVARKGAKYGTNFQRFSHRHAGVRDAFMLRTDCAKADP